MSYRSTIYRNKPGAKPAKDMERDGKKKEDGEAREKMDRDPLCSWTSLEEIKNIYQ